VGTLAQKMGKFGPKTGKFGPIKMGKNIVFPILTHFHHWGKIWTLGRQIFHILGKFGQIWANLDQNGPNLAPKF